MLIYSARWVQRHAERFLKTLKKIDFSDVPKVYVYDMNGRAYLCFPDSSLLDVELAISTEISLLGVDNDGHVN